MEPRENESAAGARIEYFQAGIRCLRGARRQIAGRNRSKCKFE